MFKVAIVGCGGIGNAHGCAWRANGAQVVAVCDPRRERAEAAARKFDATPLASIDELPDGLDCVSVVTSSDSHYEVVKKLLPRFNVFCEKPLTLKVEQGDELIRLAEQTRHLLGIGFKMRYEPIFLKAKELLPQIGKLYQVSTVKAQMYASPKGHWMERSGALCEMSIHEFDLIGFIAGIYPEKVRSVKLFHNLNWPREDGFAAFVDYSQGVMGALQCNYCSRPPFDSRDICMTFIGQDGLLRIERPDRITLRTDRQHVIDVPPAARSGFEEELYHFEKAILGQEENPLDPANANRLLAYIEEIRRVGGEE